MIAEDPNEDNDISRSTDPEHEAAKQELLQLIRDEYKDYVVRSEKKKPANFQSLFNYGLHYVVK